MLKRAWLVFAALWALLLFGIAAADATSISGGLAFIALGPLAVPLLLKWFFAFVLTGSPASRRLR